MITKKRNNKLNRSQLVTLSNYLVDISKSIILVLLIGGLFPQKNTTFPLINGFIGFVIGIISFVIGIILLQEESKYGTRPNA